VSGDLLSEAGLLAAAALAALAILDAPSQRRSAAMLTAAALCPLLIAADQWDSSLVAGLRDDPPRLAAFAAVAVGSTAALALLFRRRPQLLPLAIVAALPFRIPVEAGGEEAYLLLPLYVVIAAGVVTVAVRDGVPGLAGRGLRRRGLEDRDLIAAPRSLTWLRRMLALFVVLYALAALYSVDLSNALNVGCFFLVPFSLVFATMLDYRWDPRMLRLALLIVAGEAVLFAVVGFAEFAVRELLWNDEVIISNEFHIYFRVNSLFWDPNVYGRYLALTILLVTAAVLWARDRRAALVGAGLAGVLWLALLTTFSQSSFAALLAGLAVLAALRWSLRWTVAAVATVVVLGAGVLLAAGGSVDLDLSDPKEGSGRVGLVSGGLELFGNRPLWGYGSGSFSEAFIDEVVGAVPPVSESHSEPVTVGAEQGAIGIAAYAAILVTALMMLSAGLGSMPGVRRERDTGEGAEADAVPAAARAGILAAFVALAVHTFAYAGFFEDPIAWVLLAIGGSLAGRRGA
jgi:O-antigen ligase